MNYAKLLQQHNIGFYFFSFNLNNFGLRYRKVLVVYSTVYATRIIYFEPKGYVVVLNLCAATDFQVCCETSKKTLGHCFATFFLVKITYRDKNQEIRDRFKVKTFFFKEQYFLGTKIKICTLVQVCRPF